MRSGSILRLKIITAAFVAMYAMILAAAFHYQIVGDRSVQFYVRPNGPLENILIALIREDIQALLFKTVAGGAATSTLLLLWHFIKHVLRLRTARDDIDEQAT